MPILGAVLIHHANYPAVLRTVALLLDQGIPASLLVIVDNSQDEAIVDGLRGALPASSTLVVVENEGYGQAANVGAERLLMIQPDLDYLLVSSHETVPAPGAIAALVAALEADSAMGVVGPTLISESKQPGPRVYWSQGGILTPRLNLPRHVGYLTAVAEPLDGPVVERAWLDGAFCLYRARLFTKLRFRSEFFLYFEETEFHARIRQAGYKIGWVPEATVEQGSDGVPAFLLGRNLQLFQQMHGTRAQRIGAVPSVIARRAVGRLLGRGRAGDLREIVRGWLSAAK